LIVLFIVMDLEDTNISFSIAELIWHALGQPYLPGRISHQFVVLI